MKKFYSILVMAIAIFAFAFSSNAATISINVDDTTRVYAEISYQRVKLTPGVDNQFTVNDYDNVAIYAYDGNFLKKVTRRGSYDESVYNMTQFSQYISYAADFDGVVWDVVSVNADEARDATAIIIVDEAANVSCQRSNTYTNVNLVDGENTVKFMSQDEVPLSFSHNNYDKTIYQITLNNTIVEPSGSNYYVTPKDGDTIVVTSNYPDVDVPVKFSYQEGAENFITSVTVDNVTVDNYNDEDFSVKLGSKIVLRGNTTDYKLDSLVVNGEKYTSNYFYSYEFTATELEYDIKVYAHPYGKINVYVTVDDASRVNVFRGYSSYNDTIKLESGVKTLVEVSENNPLISWNVVSGCFIQSVTLTTENGTEDRTSYSSLSNLTEGAEINITTGVIVRDKTALVWIDDITQAQSYCSFYGSYDRYFHAFSQFTTGYNEITFGDVDNPFNMSLYNSSYSTPPVYQNDALVTYRYSYNVTFAQDDVVKIFFTTATPDTVDVTFELKGEVPAITCKKDLIKEVADWQSGISTLQGTQIDLVADSQVSVTVNGEPIAVGENNTYTFVADADCTVVIDADPAGVEDLEANTICDNNVYNLQGILVLKNATDAEIEALPAGLYIVNGKKVAVK